MQREIERKFLVLNNDFLNEEGLSDVISISQGYISRESGQVVRVRRTDSLIHDSQHGKLTLKLKGDDDTAAGVNEYEYDIPEQEASEILQQCLYPPIEKTRHIIEYGRTIWEVDVFHGHKEGLIVAEVELVSENDAIDYPKWIGKEVTGLPDYYNANM